LNWLEIVEENGVYTDWKRHNDQDGCEGQHQQEDEREEPAC